MNKKISKNLRNEVKKFNASLEVIKTEGHKTSKLSDSYDYDWRTLVWSLKQEIQDLRTAIFVAIDDSYRGPANDAIQTMLETLREAVGVD